MAQIKIGKFIAKLRKEKNMILENIKDIIPFLRKRLVKKVNST